MKVILCQVLEKCEYWRLSDQKGKPPGVVGWWPSRAITFIENHDTGSTQVFTSLSLSSRSESAKMPTALMREGGGCFGV